MAIDAAAVSGCRLQTYIHFVKVVSPLAGREPEAMKSASSRSAKRRVVKKASSSGRSQTDFAYLRTLRSEDIRITQDHPELDPAHVLRSIVRVGLKPLPPKASISLRIDREVLDWFKAQGTGYQTRINLVLRAYRDAVETAERGQGRGTGRG